MNDATPTHEITRLLSAWQKGDESARDRLIPLVYDQLRRLAAAHLRREMRQQSLEPTALVHEVFLRLAAAPASASDRTRFFGICANLIRQILVDKARARLAAKRGGHWRRARSSEALSLATAPDWDMIALDEALSDLTALDARQGRTVELRFFAGMSLEETAEVLGVSIATVRRDWETARAWLYRRLEGRPREGGGPR